MLGIGYKRKMFKGSMVQRFNRSARLLASLSDPERVALRDSGRSDIPVATPGYASDPEEQTRMSVLPVTLCGRRVP